MLSFPQGVAAHAMICADVRLTEFANYQAHDTPVPRTLLGYAVRWPLGMLERKGKEDGETDRRRENDLLINRLRVEPPHTHQTGGCLD